MGRIRTIKPEFPQSETIGRLSRDARLLFVQLWTLADDTGRCRANSRMLASLLYPYDADAPELLPGWLAELQVVGAVQVYTVAGDTFLEISNWRKHQKIDRPSAPKYPAPSEGSPIPRDGSPSPRESSPLDQGMEEIKEGRGEEGTGEDLAPDGAPPPGEEVHREPEAGYVEPRTAPAVTLTRSRKARRGPLAHFAPEDWTVSRELYDWALADGFDHAQVVRQAELFVDHEFDKPKSDWNRAFQNWLRKSREWKGGKRRGAA